MRRIFIRNADFAPWRSRIYGSMENEGCCNSWSVNFPQILWSFTSANPALLYPALPPHYYARKHVRGLVAPLWQMSAWKGQRTRDEAKYRERKQNDGAKKSNETKGMNPSPKEKKKTSRKDYRNKSRNKAELTQIDALKFNCNEISKFSQASITFTDTD